MIPTKITIADTPAILALAHDAKERGSNRGGTYDLDLLRGALHPEGSHLLSMQFLHNDIEWRTRWLCRVAMDGETPAIAGAIPLNSDDEDGEPIYGMELWLDVSFEAFEAFTHSLDTLTVEEHASK